MVHSGALWNDVFEVWTAKELWKQVENAVHSVAIWIDVLEFGTAVNILKA